MTGQPPKRPDDVPADAIWDDRWREWGHGEMKDGKKQGPWRFWREDGSLAEESVWQAGHIEDKARKRFHDDGSLASMSEYEEGRLRRITLYRSKKKTREPNLQGRPKSVREADLVFGHDRWQTTQRFRDKEGRDVDLHGKLVPPKPERVSDVAYFNSEIGLWLAGEWRNASGETIRRGLYRYWDDSGALVRLEYYTTTGQCTGCLDVRGTGEQRAFGNPLVAAARAKDDAALVTCIELGAATLPNTDWHASYEGLSELALRLAKLESTGSSIDDARIVPPARRDAPADALWVAGLDRWVRGARDKNAVAIGTWDLWLGHHEEVDFENGRRTQLRVYVDGKARRWVFYDRDGNELRSRFWDAAGLHEQLARDGAKIERLYFGEGEGLRWERVTKGYTAQEQVFYRDGTIKAEGQRDVTKSGESGRMIGTWRIAEPSGALALEIDLTKAPWKAFARREADEVADLARMSKLPETWVNTVTPKKLDLAMGWRLEAMVHGSPDLALEAYRRILHDTWDKGTITEAAARVTPILLRMLDEPSTSKPHVFDLLVRYAEALGGVGEPARRGKQGKWLRPMQTAFTDARAHALELCRDQDERLRDGATRLVGTNVFGDDLWAEVWKLFREETDGTRRAQLSLALAHLARGADALRELSRALADDREDAARFGLAMALVAAAARENAAVPFHAVTSLLTYAEHPTPPLEEAWERLSSGGTRGPLRAAVTLTLAAALAGEDRIAAAQRLVPLLVPELARETSEDAFHYVAALLAITEPRDARPTSLRDLRRQVLLALTRLPEKWWPHVHLAETLSAFGVPHASDPEKARVQIRQFAASDAPWRESQ